MDVIAAYRTVPSSVDADVLDSIRRGELDLVTFTAASTVKNFCRLFDDDQIRTVISQVGAACIGPITADAAAEAGFRIDVVADDYTILGLIEALSVWGGGSKGGA